MMFLMNQALTLLHLALSLLLAAQQPNVPEALKNQAISTAQYAITFAQDEIAHGTPAVASKTAPTGVSTPVVEECTAEPTIAFRTDISIQSWARPFSGEPAEQFAQVRATLTDPCGRTWNGAKVGNGWLLSTNVTSSQVGDKVASFTFTGPKEIATSTPVTFPVCVMGECK